MNTDTNTVSTFFSIVFTTLLLSSAVFSGVAFAAENGSVSGSVVTAEGNSDDISIQLQSSENSYENQDVLSETGEFNFSGLTEGNYTLTVSEPIHQTETRTFTLGVDENRSIGQISLAATNESEIYGQIQTEGTEDTTSITVENGTNQTVYTENNVQTGNYSIVVSGGEGPYTMSVSAPNHQTTTQSFPLQQNERTEQNFTLQQPSPAIANGTVTLENTEIQNATVELRDGDTVLNSTNVSNGGEYNFSTTEYGTYTLNVSAFYHNYSSQEITLQQSQTTTTDFSLEASPEGVVGDISTERVDYTGEISLQVENESGVIKTTSLQGNNVSYELIVPGPDTYTLTANATGYDTYSETFTISNTSELAEINTELTATERGNLSVQVTTSDNTSEPVTLSFAELDETVTVQSGTTTTFDYPTGSYTVQAEANGYNVETTQITNTQATDVANISLAQVQGVAEITIQSADATPTQNFTVQVAETGETRTVQNGNTTSFSLASGDYTVTANTTGFIQDSETITITENTASYATLSPYTPKNLTATINIENTTETTTGTVSIEELNQTQQFTDGDAVTFTELRQGEYTVTASASNHINESAAVTIGSESAQTTLNLSYDTGATGVVAITTTSNDSNASNFTVSIPKTSQTISTQENETVQVSLSPETYTIEVSADGYQSKTQTITVAENSTQAVSFELNKSQQSNITGEKLRSSESYWVGQTVYTQQTTNYTEIQWRNTVTGLTYNETIQNTTYKTDVQTITSQLGPNSDYTISGVTSTGNTTEIANVYLGVQTIDAQITPEETVSNATLDLSSNRDTYNISIAQVPGDTNQLSTTQIQSLFTDANPTIVEIQNQQRVSLSTEGTSYSTAMNFSGLERAEYNFDIRVTDTPTTDTTTVSLVVDNETQSQQTVDVRIQDAGRYWLGQELSVSSQNISAQETIGIYNLDNNQFIQELTANETGSVKISTESLGQGEFYIENSSGAQLYEFTISQQTLTGIWSDASVYNAGTQTESGLTVESNRARYTLQISGEYTIDETTEQLTDSELTDIFGNVTTTTINGTPTIVSEEVSNPETFIANFANASEGEYTFTITPEDALATETAQITVQQPADGQALFTNQFITHNVGDTGEIPLEFTGDSSTAQITIGQEDRVGYQLEATVNRPTNTTSVTLVFDSSKAGQSKPNEVLKTQTRASSVTVTSETDLSKYGDTNPRLENARYLMELQVDNQTTDLSTFNLFDAELLNSNTYALPPTITSVGDEASVTQNAVELSQIDSKSYVAFKMTIQGLGNQFNDTNRTGSAFNANSQQAENTGINFEVTKENASVNSASETLSAGQAQSYHYIQQNNTTTENQTANIWFVFDGSQFNTDGDATYTGTLTVDATQNPYLDTNQTVTSDFTFVESETTFDRHWSGDLLTLPENNQTFEGETTLPPGTQLTHEIRSENVRYPFYQSTEFTVTENQTFSTTYDLESTPLGLTFNTSIPSQMDNQTVEVVSNIQPAPPEDMTTLTVWTQADGQSYPTQVNISNPQLQSETIQTQGTPASAQTSIQHGQYQISAQTTINGTEYSANGPVSITESETNLIVNMTQSGGNFEKADPREQPDRYTLTIQLQNETGTQLDGLIQVDGQQYVVDGTTSLSLLEGDIQVTAQSYGYQDTTRTITLTQDNTETITLTQDTTIATPPETTPNENTTETTTDTPGQPGFTSLLTIVAGLVAVSIYRRKE